jgi:glyoxylase-like metal-dependent hydrolase (beta-lactamase superfamily II)
VTTSPIADPRPAQAGLVVSGIVDYPGGISSVDTRYVRPSLAASHLIVHQGRAAFVDTGTTHSVPQLLAALAAKGLAPEAVDWVFLTHIHLDHAGGAGALLGHLPNARAVVHPRGAAHLADPTKLIAATRQVYGDALYERLYGEIVPIPVERLVVTEDGTTLELAGRRFRFLHTPGHAMHHQVIHDPAAHAVFTGDAFGFSYREFDVDGRAFILPTTTPTQFDPDQFHGSVDRILALAPAYIFLTHYGRVGDIPRLGAELHAGVRALVAMTREVGSAPERAQRLGEALFEWASVALDGHGYTGDLATRHAILDDDLSLNVQGLLVWLDRRA